MSDNESSPVAKKRGRPAGVKKPVVCFVLNILHCLNWIHNILNIFLTAAKVAEKKSKAAESPVAKAKPAPKAASPVKPAAENGAAKRGRGRPPKLNKKPAKAPAVPGRGRGRPPQAKKAATTDESDDGSKEDSA